MSLVRLMKFLVDRGWSVDLLLNAGEGGMEDKVDPRVNIIHLKDKFIQARFLRTNSRLRKLKYLAVEAIPYFIGKMQEAYRLSKLTKAEYDLAAVSLHGLSAEIVCTKIKARSKVQWIRNDLSHCDPNGKADRNIRRWQDHIDFYICVSGTAKKSFDTKYPAISNRSLILYNVIDKDQMLALAEEGGNPYEGHQNLKVVTVCRLQEASKGLLRMVSVHRRLIDAGILHTWHLVGDGVDRDRLEATIAQAGVQKTFLLEGHQANPFPFYRHADVSASLSYYEGLCGAVNEAKVMGRPVVATRFSGIEEQLVDGETGIITDNSEEAVFEGMKRVLTDDGLRKRMTNNRLPQAIADDDYKLELLTGLLQGRQGAK
jgi:glycosyltransferase involved in cell wall biosynthesis